MDHYERKTFRHSKLYHRVTLVIASLAAVVMIACDPTTSSAVVVDASLVEETSTPEVQEPCTPIPSQHIDYYSPAFAHSIVPLWSTFLVADGGAIAYGYGAIQEVRSSGEIVWGPIRLLWPHSMRPNDALDKLLVTETGNSRVLVLDRQGVSVWTSEGVSPLSDSTSLKYPNDARWHNDGILITDRDDHRVLLMSFTGKVIWQYGVTGVAGHSEGYLKGPHNGKFLSNGDLLVCDSGNNRVLEIDRDGCIVWEYLDNLDWPRDASELPNGNILLTSSQSGEVIEVTRDNRVVWSIGGLDMPYSAERLPDGLTLVTARNAILWIDSAGTTVQQIIRNE